MNRSQGSITTILNLCILYHITPNDLYSEYFDIDESSFSDLCGFLHLNKDYQRLIVNNISFLNKLQNEKGTQ